MRSTLIAGLIVSALLQPTEQGGDLFGAFHYPGLVAFDTRTLKPDLQRVVEQRLGIAADYRPHEYPVVDGTDEAKSGVGKYKAMERAIVGILGKPSLGADAYAFAKDARLFYEWEGFSQPPLDEAQYATGYFNAHPRTPLAPYLRLFLLHRYRSAFEAAILEKADPAVQRNIASLYKAVWQQLQRERDPVVKAIADDIDAGPYLYVDVGRHPRR